MRGNERSNLGVQTKFLVTYMSIKSKKILNTRPIDNSKEFALLLENHGAEVINFPVIEIKPVPFNTELDSKLRTLNNYDGLIFSSSYAARFFLEQLKRNDLIFKGIVFAVGMKTKQKIESYDYKVSFIADNKSAASLSKSLSNGELRNKRFLFPRGDKSLRTIPKRIKNVDEVVVYKNVKPSIRGTSGEIKSLIRINKINCTAFFSPSAVENFLQMVAPFNQNGMQIAVIGNTTLKRARSFGLNVEIKAQTPTAENLAQAIIEYYGE